MSPRPAIGRVNRLLNAIDFARMCLRPKEAVHHVTVTPDQYEDLNADFQNPEIGRLRNKAGYVVALVYRGRPLVEGPHYRGPGVLWSKHGDVLRPHLLAQEAQPA